MAAEDLQIICYDPAAETNLSRATVFTRAMRTGFKYSHSAPVGNLAASWNISCDHLADVGFPKEKARILIWDSARNKFIWRGVLKEPEMAYERGRLSSVGFSAVGCAEGSWRQFPGPTVFGVTDVLSTINGRVSITNLGEIMSYGLTITPLINGSQGGIANGEVLTEDTRDYRGSTAPQLWEDTCNLTRGLATPFIWMVEPDETGLAALSFFAEVPNPRYWEHGNSKSNRLQVDWSAIANLIYVAFQGRLIQVPPAGDPLDYTATPDIQTAFINVSDAIREYNTAQGFADSLYTKWNQKIITGGQIVLDRDLRTNINGSLEMIPITEVRAGRAIEVEITKTPYLPGVALDVIVRHAEYDEDACTMTLSPAILTEEGKQARILAIRSEQAQSKMTWAWTDRNMASPIATLNAATPAETAIHVSNWTEGRAADPGGVAPSVTRRDSPPTYNPTTGLPSTFNPNSVPKPHDYAVPTNAKAWIIQHGAPLIAMARNLQDGLGTLGRMIHPQELPPERINIPATFSTSHPLTGSLDDGERMHTDVQEGYIDTFTVSVLGGTLTTVTVKVDVYNWDDDDIRLPDAFVIELDGTARARVQYDNSDEDHRPILLYHGDQLIWRVEGAQDDVILNCALSGDKNWGEFPVLVGPDWIPGNA